MDWKLNNRTLSVMNHILVWVFVAFIMGILWAFSLPKGTEMPAQFFVRIGIHFTLLLSAFYINYIFLVEKFLFQNHIWTYLIAILLLLAGTVLISFVINSWVLEPRPRMVSLFYAGEPAQGASQRRVFITSDTTRMAARMYPIFPDSAQPEVRQIAPRMSFLFLLIRGYSIMWISVLLVLAVGTSIKLSLHRFHSERQKDQANREKLNAELSLLKGQINPHFFFNMLNNIYSLIRSNPRTAQEAVHMLSRLMRYVLYDSSRDEVSLEEEVQFIENYIQLAKLRFSEQTAVDVNISIKDPGLPVPPLLFIPFLENIFKHGVRQSEPSTILISLKQTDDSISFTTQNRIFNNKIENSGGIGLNNVKRRLNLLYGDQYSLVIRSDEGFFKVHLTIPVYEA